MGGHAVWPPGTKLSNRRDDAGGPSASNRGPLVLGVDSRVTLAAKNVLIVAYLFPPTSTIGGGVVRALKFTKYLPQYGWRPVILTVRHSFLREDRSTLSDIPPEATVVRTLQLDPRYLTRRAAGTAVVDGPSAVKWRQRLTRLCIPDPQIGWFPFAVPKALATISRERIDAVFTTAPPFTDHLIGLALRKLTGLPWVADFRDPWVAAGRDAADTTRARLLGRFEERVLRTCDAWTTVTDGYKRVIAAGDAHIAAKGVVIANGFDPEDFGDTAWTAPTSVVRLGYGGTLYPQRTSLALFDGVKRVREQGHDVRLFVAQMAPEIRRSPVVRDLMAQGAVEEDGSLPYRDALRRLTTFDAFIVTVDRTHPGMVPGKVYEYLAVGRPILLLGPRDGTSARLLEAFGEHLVTGLDDIDGIVAGIRRLVELARAGRAIGHHPGLAQFDRRNLTGQLAGLLDSVTAHRASAPVSAATPDSHRAGL